MRSASQELVIKEQYLLLYTRLKLATQCQQAWWASWLRGHNVLDWMLWATKSTPRLKQHLERNLKVEYDHSHNCPLNVLSFLGIMQNLHMN